MLRKADFVKNIKTFNSGEDGLHFLKSRDSKSAPAPDFIFLDIQMPRMDGWEFMDSYTRLNEMSKAVPHVVMLSAAYDPDDQRMSAENELVISFIAKPITLEALDNLRQLK